MCFAFSCFVTKVPFPHFFFNQKTHAYIFIYSATKLKNPSTWIWLPESPELCGHLCCADVLHPFPLRQVLCILCYVTITFIFRSVHFSDFFGFPPPKKFSVNFVESNYILLILHQLVFTSSSIRHQQSMVLQDRNITLASINISFFTPQMRWWFIN